MTARVLFVDDDPNVLQGLRRGLRGVRREWDLAVAEGGEAALRTLTEAPADVVISDMRMPGMDGAVLLTEVASRYPATVRMALSGQCEEDASLRLVGVCHQFHSKPCDTDALTAAVRRALALRDHVPDSTLRACVSGTDHLPMSSETRDDLKRILSGADTGSEELFCLVAGDPALCAKTLQLTNNSFFGSTEAVADPNRAAQLLGAERLAAVFQVPGLTDQVSSEPAEAHDLARRCSDLAGQLADERGLAAARAAAARTAGLLANVGGLLLRHRNRGVRLDQAAVAGAFLAVLWGLPPPLSACLCRLAGLDPAALDLDEDEDVTSVVRDAVGAVGGDNRFGGESGTEGALPRDDWLSPRPRADGEGAAL